MLIPPEIYAEIQELVELQEYLYDLCDDNSSEFLEYLSKSPFLSNSDYVRKLLLCIYSAFRFNFKNTATLCKILIEIKDYLHKYLTSDDIVMNLRNNAARVALFECGIIDIASIVKDAHFNFFCFRFFYPEIKEYDRNFYENMLKENIMLQKSMKYLAKDEALHKELRRLGKSEHKITQIIRDDDINSFQEYVSLQNYALTEQIPYSAYDTNDFANSETKMPYLVECSAFYGSIKIFKYIFMTLQSMNIEFPTTLSSYAVAGGNYDIIHIVEEHLKKPNNIPKLMKGDDFLNSFNFNSSDDDDFFIDQRINGLQDYLCRLIYRNLNQQQIKNYIGFFNEKRKELSSFARNVVIQAAIEFHRNNVLEYIVENYSPKAERLLKSNKTFNSCITFLNFYQMLEFLTSDEDKDKVNSNEENSDDYFSDENDNNSSNDNNNNDNRNNDNDNNDNDNDNNDNDNNGNDNNDNDNNDNDNNDNNDNENNDNENNDNENNDNENNDNENNDNENSDNENNDNENSDNCNDNSDNCNNDNCKEDKNETQGTKPWVFDINSCPKNGIPPLLQAVFESRADVVRFLLFTKGIDVNITTSDGFSSLIFASMYGNFSIVKLLCETKRDELNFDQVASDGSSAFMMACSYGWLSIVEYLASLKRPRAKKGNNSNNENEANDDDNNDNKDAENNNQNNKVESNKVNIHDDNKNKENKDQDNNNENNEANNGNIHDDNEKAENTDKTDTNDDNEDDEDEEEFIFDINKTDARGRSPFYNACMRGHIEIVKYLATFDNIKMVQNNFFPDQSRFSIICDFLNSNPLYLKQKKEMEEEMAKRTSSININFRRISSDDDDDDDQ